MTKANRFSTRAVLVLEELGIDPHADADWWD